MARIFTRLFGGDAHAHVAYPIMPMALGMKIRGMLARGDAAEIEGAAAELRERINRTAGSSPKKVRDVVMERFSHDADLEGDIIQAYDLGFLTAMLAMLKTKEAVAAIARGEDPLAQTWR